MPESLCPLVRHGFSALPCKILRMAREPEAKKAATMKLGLVHNPGQHWLRENALFSCGEVWRILTDSQVGGRDTRALPDGRDRR